MNGIKVVLRYHRKAAHRYFAIANNPYDILGVSSTDSTTAIKKKCYKLVNKYHPDKNASPEALKLFISVKQAFEAIKAQRGLAPKPDFVTPGSDAEGFESSRPHAKQYNTNFSDFNKEWEGRDRKEFFSGINREQYEGIRSSFENIEDIKGYAFNIIDKEMPDVDKRFGLQKLMVTITSEKKYSLGYYLMALFVLSWFIYQRSQNREQTEVSEAIADQQFIDNLQEERAKAKNKLRDVEFEAERSRYLRDRAVELKRMAEEDNAYGNSFGVKSINN